MATTDEVLEAFNEYILTAIRERKPSDTILKLSEARAWVAAPDQPHGGHFSS